MYLDNDLHLLVSHAIHLRPTPTPVGPNQAIDVPPWRQCSHIVWQLLSEQLVSVTSRLPDRPVKNSSTGVLRLDKRQPWKIATCGLKSWYHGFHRHIEQLYTHGMQRFMVRTFVQAYLEFTYLRQLRVGVPISNETDRLYMNTPPFPSPHHVYTKSQSRVFFICQLTLKQANLNLSPNVYLAR